MKRIEAIIQSQKLNDVVKALEQINITGLTVTKSQGRGAGERPLVGGARGTTQYVAEFNVVNSLITVVADSQVNSAISAIVEAAHTGRKGDGKIFITNVEEAVDISTKEKGPNII